MNLRYTIILFIAVMAANCAVKPRGAFLSNGIPEVPDYSDATAWAALPEMIDSADVTASPDLPGDAVTSAESIISGRAAHAVASE